MIIIPAIVKFIVTPILAAKKFYPAEEYHRDCYKKNPLRYQLYRFGSVRKQFLEKIWQEKEGKLADNKDRDN